MSVSLAFQVQAQQIVAAGSGFSAPTQTITFCEVVLGSGASLTNQYAGYNVSFAPGAYYPQPGFFSTAAIGNFSFCCGPQYSPVSLVFANNVSGAAFNFMSNGGTSVFTALLDNVVVSSFSVYTSTATTWAFYGFDNMTLDEVQILAGGDGAFELDNLQTNEEVTPEPASLVLLGTGLAGIVDFARRRRNA